MPNNGIKPMMRIFILGVFFMFGFVAFGQGTIIQLKAKVRDDDNGKSLGGATIEVYKGGSLVASENSSSNGKVPSIDLPVCIGCTYKIVIKKAGYVTKTAIVDGHSDYPEELPPGVVTQPFDVSIFETVEGIDFSFLEREPMVEFAIDSYGIVDFDQDKIKIMLKKIEGLKKKMEEKKEELEKAEKEKAKQEADFQAYVEAGDAAVKNKDYEKGIGQYELALGIKPDDQPTKDKITDAKIKLEEMRAAEELDKNFNAKMAEAKKAYSDEELEKALTLYKEASGIKPDEQLPKDLIAEIQKKLDAQKENEAAFNQLVAEGDAAVAGEKFDDGISKYEAALKMKKDPAVQTKLDDARKKKAELESAAAAEKEKQDKFDQLMAKADAAFDTEKYEDAKKNYEEALKVIPEEQTPKDKIAAIDKILKEREAELAAKEKLEADYQNLMAEGKEKINQREWEDAKSKYEEALKLKPADPDALAQIDLIRKEIEKAAGEAKLDAEYDGHMAAAKTLFDQKKYSEAKSEYNLASGVKPTEQEPKDKIAEIEKLLADQEKAAELEQQYNDFMTQGDAANDRKDYIEALDRYNKALEAKPGDSAAQSKIDAINEKIAEEKRLAEEQAKFDELVAAADQSYNAKDYDKAKLNYNNALDIKDDPALRDKIAEIDALIAKNQSEAETQAKYDTAIKEADDFYNANDYPAALEKYKAAYSIKEDAYPKGRIADVEEKIAANQAAAEKEEQFSTLVSEAEAAYDAEDYAKSLTKYKEAIKVKPDPTLTQKIADLNVLLAAEAQNADKKAKYDKKIEEADVAFDNKNWNAARGLYTDAAGILPAETYPDERITEIEKRIAEESANEAEAAFQKVIAEADENFNNDKLDNAKVFYEQALSMKPGDAYAQDQIDKIATIKKERADALSAEKQLEEDYKNLIAEGDESFNAENWSAALNKYKEALKLKPTESYPENRIAEINTKMNAADAQKAIDEEYNGYVKKADDLFDNQEYMEAIAAYNEALTVKPTESYPKDKIASAENFLKLETENEEEAAYQKILDVAQKKFDEKDYEKALELYLRAKTTKPSDPLPQSRIDEINQIVLKMGETAELEEQYNDFIQKADNDYEKGEWKKAKESYTAAFNLFNREYPEKRIKECEDAMKAETASTENKQYDKLIRVADEKFKDANYKKAKELYERAIGFKPTDQYPKDQLAEIDKILNPAKTVKTKTNMRDYGDPNRSTNFVDVDNMLKDAELQREFIRSQKAEQQQIDASDAEAIDNKNQTDENFDTRESVVLIEEDLQEAAELADDAQIIASDKVEVMQVENIEVERERGVLNENDVQIQNQIVNNINTELSESQVEGDLPREAYLLDVEEIRSEIILEENLQDVDQTNATFDQKDYVDEYVENRIENDVNMDVARKNTEVMVEDQNIQLINAKNENTWDQEDVILEVKDQTEIEIDERAILEANRDIPRIEEIALIEGENLDRIEFESNLTDDQYDVTIDQKKYTENIINEIEIENLANDIPREEMEDFVEKQKIENLEVDNELTLDQNNALFNTEKDVEEMEILIEENTREDDKDREGYEKVVDNIKEDKQGFLDEKDAENKNESFATVDYIENGTKDRRDASQVADEKADDLIDDTKDMADKMNEEQNEMEAENNEDLENVEDYVESLRDIKVDEIDEEMKNALGDQFPEGMTEEIYTLEDENGLMTHYVIRRIVVRNGTGNVYEKVQTKFGTVSYTCNGHGISEYEWQDQTAAADLVRN